MAQLSKAYAVKTVILPPGVQVYLKAPIDTNFMVMRNVGSSNVKIITDPNDPTAVDDIAPGVQNPIGGTKIVSFTAQPFPAVGAPVRFSAGSTICILECDAGGEIRAQFVF